MEKYDNLRGQDFTLKPKERFKACAVHFKAEQKKLSGMLDIRFTPAGPLCSHCGEEDEAVIIPQTGLTITVLLALKGVFTLTANRSDKAT